MRKTTLLPIVLAAVFVLSALLPAAAQSPPPYIQPGLVFVYQLVDIQKQQPENAFHRWIIESVSGGRITIRIQSDVLQSGVVEVNAAGEILGGGGNRIDLWLPPDVQQGSRLKIFGADAVVVQRGYQMQQITATIVASTDQTIFWAFVESGPSPYDRLPGLLLIVHFANQKKGLVLVNIEQAGAVTTTRAETTRQPVTTRQQTAVTTTRVVGGTTLTQTETVETTIVTTRETTVTQSFVTTVSTTQTVTVESEPPQAEPSFPLPIAAVAAVGIISGALFIRRARKAPPPPTYPYPPYPSMPPQQVQPQPYTMPPAAICPACRFQILPNEYFCRRCGYRLA